MSPLLRRMTTLAALLALGLTAAGCTKCGWIWDDWNRPGACRVDKPNQAH